MAFTTKLSKIGLLSALFVLVLNASAFSKTHLFTNSEPPSSDYISSLEESWENDPLIIRYKIVEVKFKSIEKIEDNIDGNSNKKLHIELFDNTELTVTNDNFESRSGESIVWLK